MRYRQIVLRLGMWGILVGILVGWLADAIRNPRLAQTVFAVAFSPDSTLLAMGTDDGSVVFYDFQTQKQLEGITRGTFPNWTKFVLFAPDGRTLVAGGDGNELMVCDVASRQCLRILGTQFGYNLNCATFSSDGSTIATGSEDDTIRLWKCMERSSPREIITRHKQRINTIAYSPDGSLLATGSDDETIKLTEVESGKERATLFWDDQSEVNTGVKSVAFSPDGETLLAGMDHGTVVVWDVNSLKERIVLHPHSDEVSSVTFANSGAVYATGSWDGTVKVFDSTNNAVVHSFSASTRWVWSVAFSPDSRNLAAGCDNGAAKIWDLNTGKSTSFIAEHATVQWWLLSLIIWAVGFSWIQSTPENDKPTPSQQRTEAEQRERAIAVESAQPELMTSAVVYIVGGLIYVVLCAPAIGQRGFPPIDPAWTAMTFLWVCPIILAEMIDDSPLKSRLKLLTVYCLVTSFFDAAAVVTSVPKHVDLVFTILAVIFPLGPLHLVVGFIVAGLARGIGTPARTIVSTQSGRTRSVLQWITVAAVLCLTTAFPVLFRQYVFLDSGNRGRAQAENDWNEGHAKVYLPDHPTSGLVQHEFDSATGLKYANRWRADHYSKAYNQRVAELLRERGIPGWSMKPYLVDDDEITALLDSDEFEEIQTFPYEINDNLILFRRGTISRWGGSMSSSNDSLSIGSKSGLYGAGGEAETAYIWRNANYPKVIFVRSGHRWIGAFHESGQLLSSASRL